MKPSTLFLSALSLGVLTAAIPAKRDEPTDVDILNFALTLEHLESWFYQEGLAKYSQQDFSKAGFDPWVRDRYQQIARHEAKHVEFLSGALGDKAVKRCQYKFPDTDPSSFVVVSNLLEGVGTSAYTGAAKYISNKDYLTAAATILTVEARHAGWISSSVRKGSAWGTAFDIPLDLNQVYTIASALIDSCPDDNPKLPVHAFPALTVSRASPTDKYISLSFTAPSGTDPNKPLYAAFLTGDGVIFSPIAKKGGQMQAEVPQGLMGYVYVIVTNAAASVSDDDTVAGPAVLEVRVDSMGHVL